MLPLTFSVTVRKLEKDCSSNKHKVCENSKVSKYYFMCKNLESVSLCSTHRTPPESHLEVSVPAHGSHLERPLVCQQSLPSGREMLLDSPQTSVVLLDQSRLSTLHPLVELGDCHLTLLLLLLDHHLHLLMIFHLDVCAGRETAAEVMKEDERKGRSGKRIGRN